MEELTALLDQIDWFSNPRAPIEGDGHCLGGTSSRGGVRIAPRTREPICEAFVKAFNAAVSRALGGRKFWWGGLQLNRNTVAQSHRDVGNLGLSFVVLFGRFQGGNFKMTDGTCGLKGSQIGQLLTINGQELHESEAFEGTRYSVVAFLHGTSLGLPLSDQLELNSFGFRVLYNLEAKAMEMERSLWEERIAR